MKSALASTSQPISKALSDGWKGTRMGSTLHTQLALIDFHGRALQSLVCLPWVCSPPEAPYSRRVLYVYL
jgi:hypothetical protein